MNVSREVSMFEKGRNKVIEISQERVIWEKCFREEICVKIPFDGRKCLKAEACIRILESGGRFYIELQLFGGKVRYELANACFPAYTIGIARLEVCANVGKDSVCLGAKLCIGGKIDGIDLGKCWKIYEGCIKFISTADLMASDGKSVRLDDAALILDAMNAGAGYVHVDYVEMESAPVPPDFDLKAAMARYKAA